MNSREQLLARWETYSAGLPSAGLELRVAQRALRDGCSAKEVALILVAGSETVRLIYNKQGREKAIAFAQHIVKIARLQETGCTQRISRNSILEIER